MTTPDTRTPWDDETLDRVLRDAVAVEPSPEFRARVSAWIAREPVPHRRLPRWSWSVAAAAVAAGVVWVALARPPERPEPARQDLEGRGFSPAALPGTIDPPEIRSVITRLPAPVVRAQFDPRERAALDDLLGMTVDGWLALPDSLALVAPEDEVAVTPIAISDIDIPALHIATDEAREGEPEP